MLLPVRDEKFQLQMKMALVLQTNSVQKGCEAIINCVRDSSLNFSLQETPYSMYITLRKSFVKSRKAPNFLDLKSGLKINDYKNELEILRNQLIGAEKKNNSLKNSYEETLIDSEASYKKIEHLESKLKES